MKDSKSTRGFKIVATPRKPFHYVSHTLGLPDVIRAYITDILFVLEPWIVFKQ